MAAPRKYNDPQRAAMFRLYEAGKSPAEIAKACEEGTAGTSPFEIPRRTVHEIVKAMAEEAEQKLPTSVAEAESADAVERYPVRIAGIVKAEIDRLEAKQGSRGLTPEDLDRLKKAMDLSLALEKRLRRSAPATGKRGGAREGTGSRRGEESPLERLAREQTEIARGEEPPSPARARHNPGESEDDPPVEPAPPVTPAPPPTAPANGSEPSAAAAHVSPLDLALAARTPADRAEVAAQARAALAG